VRHDSNVPYLIQIVLGVGKRVYQRYYRAQKKVDQNVNHEAFNSGIWEPEDTLHGIEGMWSLKCVIAYLKHT